ncbi:MAG: S9 family peptidase [Flavobacteriales bacterium]
MFFLLFVAVISVVSAQKKDISLEDIWSKGTFRTERISALQSLKNGKEYSVLNYHSATQSSTIDVYDYLSGTKGKTLINTQDFSEVDYILSYSFSEDETKILIASALDPIYRYSTLGTYYVYDITSKKLSLVSDKKIQEPTFSPDGTKIAYGYENNLFVKEVVSEKVTQITFDGKKNSIINGITDWVYEEEFAFVRAFQWNKDGSKIAFIRFDESQVPEYSMDIIGKNLYPTQQVFKYPKAGENNAEVSLHLYDVNKNKVSKVDLSQYHNYYIPRILWTSKASVLSVQLMNRHQNKLDLVFVDANTNSSNLILHEEDQAYIDIKDDLTFLNTNNFIWTSEKDGWNHIYFYDKTGQLIQQITKGNWEVTNYYGFDEHTGRIFYQSTENGSINRDVYSVLKSGKNKVRLTQKTGTNRASFSTDYSFFINTFSNVETPTIYTLNESKTGKELREIKNNNALINKLKEYKISSKEFLTININGEELNMYMIKPLDFNPNIQYPLLMYQYSGPGSQMVANRWNGSNDYWHQMLVQQGFIVVCVDGRGTGLKGRDFKKMTQLQLGKYEVEDQIAVAKKLGERPYIDASRIGIWGWSYGGFMASNCLFQGNDVFKMAIAVAPVGSWRFYDTIYTERYMQTPQENPSGYDDNSPITHVDKLKGNFLLVHGSADDNVHLQNSMQMIEGLIQANKQFDWAIYPDKNHGIYGGNTRLHLFTKLTNFVKENL